MSENYISLATFCHFIICHYPTSTWRGRHLPRIQGIWDDPPVKSCLEHSTTEWNKNATLRIWSVCPKKGIKPYKPYIEFNEHIFPNGLVQPPTSADWRFPSIHENSRKLVRYQRSLFRPRRRLLKCHRHNFTGKIQLPKTKENMCWKVLFMGQI